MRRKQGVEPKVRAGKVVGRVESAKKGEREVNDLSLAAPADCRDDCGNDSLRRVLFCKGGGD